MNLTDFIEVNPEKLGGEPVFKGTRIPLSIFFDYLEAGRSVEAFLDDFETDRNLVYHFAHAWREQPINLVTPWTSLRGDL